MNSSSGNDMGRVWGPVIFWLHEETWWIAAQLFLVAAQAPC